MGMLMPVSTLAPTYLRRFLPHIIAEHGDNAELLYDVKEKLEAIQTSIETHERKGPKAVSASDREAFAQKLYGAGKYAAEFNLLDSLCSVIALQLVHRNKASLVPQVIPVAVWPRVVKNIGGVEGIEED